jgi:hypothetical protein
MGEKISEWSPVTKSGDSRVTWSFVESINEITYSPFP